MTSVLVKRLQVINMTSSFVSQAWRLAFSRESGTFSNIKHNQEPPTSIRRGPFYWRPLLVSNKILPTWYSEGFPSRMTMITVWYDFLWNICFWIIGIFCIKFLSLVCKQWTVGGACDAEITPISILIPFNLICTALLTVDMATKQLYRNPDVELRSLRSLMRKPEVTVVRKNIRNEPCEEPDSKTNPSFIPSTVLNDLSALFWLAKQIIWRSIMSE